MATKIDNIRNIVKYLNIIKFIQNRVYDYQFHKTLFYIMYNHYLSYPTDIHDIL